MKTLVIGPSWIGDMMISHSLYRLLMQHYPGMTIDVIAPSWCQPLLKRMPEVNRDLTMPIGHRALALKKRWQLGQSFQKDNYQQAIVLPNSFKSALIPFFARIPRRIGWRGEMRYGLLNDLRHLNQDAFPLMVDRYAALAFDAQKIRIAADLPRPLLRPRLKVDKFEAEAALKAFSINGKRELIGFCPGAEFGPAKRWPHYHYSTLAKKLIDKGYQIVLFGSAKDREIGLQISSTLSIEQQNYCRNLTGETNLDQAIILISACKGIVSNDTGLMHVTCALQRPLVALYGPTSPEFAPPLSNQAKIIRLISGYYKIRRGSSNDGYHQSLIDIQPTQVIAELDNLFDLSPPLLV